MFQYRLQLKNPPQDVACSSINSWGQNLPSTFPNCGKCLCKCTMVSSRIFLVNYSEQSQLSKNSNFIGMNRLAVDSFIKSIDCKETVV